MNYDGRYSFMPMNKKIRRDCRAPSHNNAAINTNKTMLVFEYILQVNGICSCCLIKELTVGSLFALSSMIKLVVLACLLFITGNYIRTFVLMITQW
jgi:hypothetical protein